MNEITRIHIAKTPYDIEVAAKKELEKYIKSLELYTQDADVLADIEIRITELLAEEGVIAGAVIGSKDVTAVRAKLGEPYEFADDETDIAVGPEATTTSRRFYRSTDDAVLGGVLSGLAAFLKVNPLWVRLGFVVLLFISFGFASFIYILLWIITPAARTATEKLQLAGKEVTVESIRNLNAAEEATPPNKVAPVIQRILTIAFGTISLLGSVMVFIGATGLLIAASTSNEGFLNGMNNFVGMGAENTWIVWLVFGIVIFGLLLLASLLGLIAYGFFAKKATKRMIVSAVIITIFGIASATAAFGISASQSWRVSSETQSMMRETTAKLPANFTNVTTVNFTMKGQKNNDQTFSSAYPLVRYIVDDGPVRYELNALPTTKTAINVDGANATVEIEIPESYRNAYVQPTLTVYGPALQAIRSTASLRLYYSGNAQSLVNIQSGNGSNISVDGSYEAVEVQGSGSVDLGSSAIATLRVVANQNLSVVAGTVRTLSVTQPDVCSNSTYKENTSVTVSGVTSGEIAYNGIMLPVASHQTSCAVINIESDDENATI